MEVYQIGENDTPKWTTLGFNLIVRNEENCLAQTLENIRPLADEIVVTDTGSTDNTVSIAESLADKVLFHAWQDSFSEARNWSLQHSTTNWICSIDADEWIENPETIDVTQWNGAQTLLCPIHSDMPNGQIARHFLPKIFRNHTAHFEGIVHNQLIYSEPALATDITFRHSGYNESPEIMKKKQVRTIGLLEKQLTDDPENTFALMNLGRSLLNHGDAERARAVTANGLSIERGNTPIRQMLLYNRALCEIEQKHFDTAWQTLIEALTLNPHHLDYLFLRAHVAFEQGRWLDCILSLRAYEAEQTRQRSTLRVNNLLTDYYDAGVRIHVYCLVMPTHTLDTLRMPAHVFGMRCFQDRVQSRGMRRSGVGILRRAKRWAIGMRRRRQKQRLWRLGLLFNARVRRVISRDFS